MKKVTGFLVIGLLVCSSAFAMGNSPKCSKDYYPGNGTNARLMWTNVTKGVLPMSNAQAITIWENTVKVQKAATRDYSASIALLSKAITEAQAQPSTAQAKNPYFNASKPEDKPDLFWACENGK